MMTDNPSIAALLDKLYHPGLARVDLTLARVERFLHLLCDPHKKLPPVIHVAGTNGKGSLIANLHAIFDAAGYTVHRYISPHLIRFNERILVRGQEIGDDYLEALLQRVVATVEKQPVTFFEATTAAAFLAFSEQKADVVLLETGMGGLLDATNVVEAPLITAITPVALDHCEYLGNTLVKIAHEKAGILKPGVTCVIGRQPPDAARALADRAAEIHAPLYRLGVEWQWAKRGETARYQSPKRETDFAPGLVGMHQYDNAAMAVACLDHLPQFRISPSHIESGLAKVEWPGRLQKLDRHPYRALLRPTCELWLDGGHNPQGGEVLAAWLAAQNREVHLICGMLTSKDARGYFKALAPCVSSVTAIAIPGEPDSQPAGAVAEAARGAGINVLLADSIENALQTLPVRANTPAIVCICGSLYLAGRVLAVK
jgi:dihydrofolate synthase / folylpolyglutamate synthase